jgi:hypothetical protein
MLSLHRLCQIAIVALGAAVAACSSPPPEPTIARAPTEAMHPGAYVGSWKQPVNDGWSTITIAEGPDGLQFSWTAEGRIETVRCDSPGVCRSFIDGAAQFEYRYRMFERPYSPFLHVECRGTPLVPGAGAPLRYVDRLELAAGGQELWAHTIEAEGFKANRPVKLTRIANTAP